jgi:hypothetical protein
MLLAALAVLAGIVIVASGRGGEMAYEHPDYPPLDLGPVTAADVALLRPPSAAWGYNRRVTDEALAQIARAMSERDVRISALEQRVSDLHEELSRGLPPGPRARHGAPGGEETRPDFTTELPRPVWPPAIDIVPAASSAPEGEGQAADAASAHPGPADHWAGEREPRDEQTADDVAPGAEAEDTPEEQPAPGSAPEQQPAGGPPWAFRSSPRPGPGGNGGPLGRAREEDEAGD